MKVTFPAIPSLFVVGELPEGGFFVYPKTNPPRGGEIGPRNTIPDRETAELYARRMNFAVNEHIRAVFQDALGALTNDIVVYGSIPGSSVSEEARSWLLALGRALLNQSVAVAACIYFQRRLAMAREDGKKAVRMDMLLQRLGLTSGVKPSLN